jgi:hypothetical protein
MEANWETLMEEHLVAFIDLLGFRSIITASDDARRDQILLLLTSLAEAKGDFKSETKTIDANTRAQSIRPAISAFSDNIVFSFPAVGLASVGTGPIITYLGGDIARIFTLAIGLGCLVRGGIAFGPLYHAGGVLFGPALVEAYEMESKFAGRSRIIVSPKAAERLGDHPYLRPDDDGFLCLDYIRATYDQVPFGPPGTTVEMQSKRNWITRIREHCSGQITALSQTKNLAGVQNWRWFATCFDRFVAKLDHSITGE